MSVDVVVTTMSYLICEHNYCTMFTSTIITYYIIACSQHHQDKVDRTNEMVSVHSTSRAWYQGYQHFTFHSVHPGVCALNT